MRHLIIAIFMVAATVIAFIAISKEPRYKVVSPELEAAAQRMIKDHTR